MTMPTTFALLLALVDATPTKVAVMPVQLDPSAADEVPALINDVVLTAVQNLGKFEVIGQDDVNALLGFEQQKDLLGCDDASCIADIGGALGVDKILVMKVARVGTDWVTTLKLIDIKGARVERRSSDFVPGTTKDLLVAVPSVVSKLFGVATTSPPTTKKQPPAQAHTSTQVPAQATPPSSATPSSPPGIPAPVPQPRVDRRGRGLALQLSGGGGGATLYTDLRDKPTTAAAFGLRADYWFSRYFMLGMGFHYLSVTPSCDAFDDPGVICSDTSVTLHWSVKTVGIGAAVHPARWLKIFTRLDLGMASSGASGTTLNVRGSNGGYAGLVLGVWVQPWRRLAFLLDYSGYGTAGTGFETDRLGTTSGTDADLSGRLTQIGVILNFF